MDLGGQSEDIWHKRPTYKMWDLYLCSTNMFYYIKKYIYACWI